MAPDWRLSRSADADFTEIAEYTIDRWGEGQARRYVEELQAALDVLAGQPAMGAVHSSGHGIRRWRHAHHHIFYVEDSEGVLVVRALHVKRDPTSWPEDG